MNDRRPPRASACHFSSSLARLLKTSSPDSLSPSRSQSSTTSSLARDHCRGRRCFASAGPTQALVAARSAAHARGRADLSASWTTGPLALLVRRRPRASAAPLPPRHVAALTPTRRPLALLGPRFGFHHPLHLTRLSPGARRQHNIALNALTGTVARAPGSLAPFSLFLPSSACSSSDLD